MARKDFYFNKAKQEGYRSRAAYKLQQLDEGADLLSTGDAVVDLGAAPGGWMQVAAERIGDGHVVGVDFQRIDDVEDVAATVTSMTGDVTADETLEAIREQLPDGTADVILSDMAPNMTGNYGLDQARSAHLANRALDIGRDLLAPGGNLAVKVFEGEDTPDLRERIEEHFEYVRTMGPDASRESSAEIYLVGSGFVDAPVQSGDVRRVEIVDVGSEGDGIASIDGYRVFVPNVEVGESVEVEITDVKARFGFAQVR